MEEIKVGEYIRDCVSGEIGKVVEVNPNYYRKEDGFKIWRGTFKKIKHSPNIMDLIEEEDIAVLNCYGFKVKKIVKQDDILELKLGNYELLEILTKQQFNQMKYIVGDESNE